MKALILVIALLVAGCNTEGAHHITLNASGGYPLVLAVL
jgi:hypothetical protein